MRGRLAILSASLATLAAVGPAGATTFQISTRGGNTINGGPGFQGGDVIRYDDVGGTQTEIFDEAAHWPPPGEELDAFELLSDGTFILSFDGSIAAGTLGGWPFEFLNGDLILYDPVNDVASPYFIDESQFVGNPNIDAVAVLPNGNVLFSTLTDGQTQSGLSFLDGDVVEYDPLLDTFSVFAFNEGIPAWGGQDIDIDAFDVTEDGLYAFSTELDVASFPGLASGFSRSDLVLYNLNTNTATILLDESVFGDPVNSPLDAVAVPEPGSAALLALGLAGLALASRRRAS